jgi:hypothetical protein
MQLRRARVPVPDGLLHALELRTVLSAVVRKVARIECAE